MFTPIARLTTIGTTDTNSPKINEASMSPRIMVCGVTGHDINLSRVLDAVSIGATAGDIEVEVKNSTMPRSPGSMTSAGIFLPTTKEK